MRRSHRPCARPSARQVVHPEHFAVLRDALGDFVGFADDHAIAGGAAARRRWRRARALRSPRTRLRHLRTSRASAASFATCTVRITPTGSDSALTPEGNCAAWSAKFCASASKLSIGDARYGRPRRAAWVRPFGPNAATQIGGCGCWTGRSGRRRRRPSRFAPGGEDGIERFVEAVALVARVDAEGFEHRRLEAAADTEDRAAVRELVERRDLRGDAQRIVDRDQQRRRAESYARGDGGDRRERDDRRRRRARPQVTLGQPDRVEAVRSAHAATSLVVCHEVRRWTAEREAELERSCHQLGDGSGPTR